MVKGYLNYKDGILQLLIKIYFHKGKTCLFIKRPNDAIRWKVTMSLKHTFALCRIHFFKENS